MGLMNPSWLSGPRRICLGKQVPPEMTQLLIDTLDTVRSQNKAAVSGGKTSSLCAQPSSNLELRWLPCISPLFHCLTVLNLCLLSAHCWSLVAQLPVGHHPSPWECTHTSRFSLHFTELTWIAGPFPAGASCDAFEAAEAGVSSGQAQKPPCSPAAHSLPVLQASSLPEIKAIRESPWRQTPSWEKQCCFLSSCCIFWALQVSPWDWQTQLWMRRGKITPFSWIAWGRLVGWSLEPPHPRE